jgi:hypothetical protein
MLFCLEPASFTMHFECAACSSANSVLVQQLTGHDWPLSLSAHMSFDRSFDLSCDGNTCAGQRPSHGVELRTCICHCSNAAYDTGMQALHLYGGAACLVTGVLCIANPPFTEAHVIICAAFICLSAVTTNPPITPACSLARTSLLKSSHLVYFLAVAPRLQASFQQEPDT